MSATSKVYSSRSIANYLLARAAPAGGLDALQTIKLTYIAHGFTLGFHDDPLIEDDVEAWKFGPVVRPIYTMVPYGQAKIPGPLSAEVAQLEPRDQSLLNSVFDNYSPLSGLRLSSMTHMAGTPWDLTWRRYGQNSVIPRELIRSHYKRVINGGSAAISTYGL